MLCGQSTGLEFGESPFPLNSDIRCSKFFPTPPSKNPTNFQTFPCFQNLRFLVLLLNHVVYLKTVVFNTSCVIDTERIGISSRMSTHQTIRNITVLCKTSSQVAPISTYHYSIWALSCDTSEILLSLLHTSMYNVLVLIAC